MARAAVAKFAVVGGEVQVVYLRTDQHRRCQMDGVERADERRERLRGAFEDDAVERHDVERVQQAQDGFPVLRDRPIAELFPDACPIDRPLTLQPDQLAGEGTRNAPPLPQHPLLIEDDGVAGAAGSLVLLGDPQQLDQPRKGVHPPGAERSALEHLLGEASTMPPNRGLFMETTRRLHPDVCRFTSELFYDSRLTSEPDLSRQALRSAGPLAGTGLRFVPVPHTGNDVESIEEADAVAALASSLVDGGASWVDMEGRERPLGWDDVLIVAPYNKQVAAIAQRLPPQARVGTVDKFQGQAAPVSIYSMTSPTADDAPRGMSFLYSRHRLNVATSRARCVAVVVASPALAQARARTPEQMRLANALCRFVEMASRSGPLIVFPPRGWERSKDLEACT